MKFYVNRILYGITGKPLLNGKSEAASVPLTLGTLAVEALLLDLPQDNGTAGSIKIARYNLAKKLQAALTVLNRDTPDYEKIVTILDEAKFLELKTEDVNLIKGRIQAPQAFTTVVIGAAEEAIESGDILEAVPIGKKKS